MHMTHNWFSLRRLFRLRIVEGFWPPITPPNTVEARKQASVSGRKAASPALPWQATDGAETKGRKGGPLNGAVAHAMRE